MDIQSIIKKKRKYDTAYRKKVTNKINKIKDKEDLIKIYNIITEDIGTNYSNNRNGIFFNMNILSDDCIEKLVEYLESKNNSFINIQSEEEKVEYRTYKIDDVELITEMGHKLSNQEKNLLKRIKNKI